MKKIASYVIVFLFVFFGFLFNASGGDKIDFSLKNLQDTSIFTAADYRDNYLIIVFGSIYCRPCIQLLPVMNNLYSEYKESGVIVLGIDIDHTTKEDRIKSFIQQHEISFPFLIDNKNLARQMKVAMLPVILMVDKGGKIVSRHLGFKPFSFFESELEKMGAEKEN